jgi:hypothetical protein
MKSFYKVNPSVVKSGPLMKLLHGQNLIKGLRFTS